MDPISLILAALVAGAAAGVKETADSAIKDAYAGLKALVARKLGRDGAAQAPADSDAERAALEGQLRSAGAGSDQELIDAANTVLKSADPDGWNAGKYKVTISNSKGIVSGDYNQVTMKFGDD